MAGGTPGFIAEIAGRGKLNLPASLFFVYDGNVNDAAISICFLQGSAAPCRPARQALDATLVLWYIGTTLRKGHNDGRTKV
jgi:hypothetical protein